MLRLRLVHPVTGKNNIEQLVSLIKIAKPVGLIIGDPIGFPSSEGSEQGTCLLPAPACRPCGYDSLSSPTSGIRA
ncbi:unnamed protein product [Cuscuta campestris]|uniref:Uncharacterized protein n=1 Tax=Cuscuta campestris TaxID=132261 RepID=A0A484MAW6_9ASTE|nr:unnamed protein product [Cuscuta campestris]